MKINKSCLLIFFYIGACYSECDNRLSEEIGKEIRTNRLDIFIKLSKLYEPILDFSIDQKNFEKEWDSINTYITCGIRQYLFPVVPGKYTPDYTKIFWLFDRTREDLQVATNEIMEKKKKYELKQNLNFLKTDKDEVLDVLNESLKALDKSVQSKIKPEIIMPDFKNFYNKLINFAARNPSNPFDTLNAQQTMIFLTDKKRYQDRYNNSILPENSVKKVDIKMVYSNDPLVIQKAKYFAIKLQEIIYALKSETSFEIPFFGSSRATQIKVLQKVIKILQEGFGFDITSAIPVTKLASLKDMMLFCMIAEAVGIYDALRVVIDYIQPKPIK